MNKSLILNILTLLSISLFASTDALFSSTNTNNQPNIAELKELYATRAKYATYGTGIGLVSYLTIRSILDHHNPSFNFKISEFSKLCAVISTALGFGNGAKWLFLNLFPESTISDVNAINIFEKLAYAILALQLPEKYECYREMCSRIELRELNLIVHQKH